MGRIRERFAQWRKRRSVALTLFSVVLAAAMFGFTAAGVWYQFCLAHGDPEPAAAFADFAPPVIVVVLATVGLIGSLGVQFLTLLDRARTAQHPRETPAVAGRNRSVPPCVVLPERVPDLMTAATGEH